MFHTSVTGTTLAVAALVGLASTAAAQRERAASINAPVEIVAVERVLDLVELERADPSASARRGSKELVGEERTSDLVEERTAPSASARKGGTDMARFRVHFKSPPLPEGAALESDVILEATLANGMKQTARTMISGPPSLVELELPGIAPDMKVREVTVRIRSKGSSASAGKLRWDEARTFSGDEVKILENAEQ